jgi:hypothetical protein
MIRSCEPLQSHFILNQSAWSHWILFAINFLNSSSVFPDSNGYCWSCSFGSTRKYFPDADTDAGYLGNYFPGHRTGKVFAVCSRTYGKYCKYVRVFLTFRHFYKVDHGRVIRHIVLMPTQTSLASSSTYGGPIVLSIQRNNISNRCAKSRACVFCVCEI